MSRMAQEGVRCRDCHEPHAGGLKAPGNALCLSCHDQALAAEAHTHHAAGSPGAACVGCHMPPLVLMERDVRRDHRLTVPDPARAAAIGARDACTTCHTSESQRWAAEWTERWYGTAALMRRERVLAHVFEGGRHGEDRAAPGLVAALQDAALDPVRRASAARLLEPWAHAPQVVQSLQAAARADDPWLRASAVRSLGAALPTPEDVLVTLEAATSDPARVVRVEAAFALRGLDVATLDPARRRPLEAAFGEWLDANAVLADLPESHFNRGLFFGARGDAAGAVASYRAAIRLWPWDMAPRHNLAMTLEAQGDTAAARLELLAALERDPDFVPAHFDLARLWAADQDWGQAAAALERCLAAAPSYPRAAYTLALIHLQQGEHERAFDALERATDDPASRTEALRELVRLAHRVGDTARRDRWLPAAILADPAIGTDPRVRAALAGGS
jgi:predicted CXXCH cytochrome family protein